MGAPAKQRREDRRTPPLHRLRSGVRWWSRSLAARLGLLPLAPRGYLICATPRTGSNYLCELLGSTGQLGNPEEYFNTTARQVHLDPDYPRSRRTQIHIVRSDGATPNGIYAVKVLPLQYRRVAKKIDLFRELPALELVRLRRRDLLGQALSLMRARQTGQILASNRSRSDPVYDAEQIKACIRDLREREAIWDRVIRERGAQPLDLAYEDVMGDPQAAVDKVAALMGLALPVSIAPDLVRVKVQRDRKTDFWRERFLAEAGEEFRELAG